jgi:hypothetical protein
VKRRDRRKKSVSVAAGVVLAGGLTAAADAADRELRAPALSLARLQTAQIHLGIPPDPVVPSPGAGPACQATLEFVDAEGRPFLTRTGEPVSREVSLLPGQTRSLSLPAAVVCGDGQGLRALFRGVVRLGTPPDPVTPDPCAGAQASVEIYDTLTGRTTVGLGVPPEPIVPQP